MDGSSVESDSAKSVESTTSDDSNRFDFHNKFPLVGIQDIVTLLGEYKSKNLNISAAGKKDTCPFFPRLDLSSFWAADEPRILAKKGILADFDGAGSSMNLHVSLTGKSTKIPEEHDWVGIQEESLTVKTSSRNQVVTGVLIKEPSDTGTTQNRTKVSSKKESQTLPEGGKPSTQAFNGQTGSASYSRSSSGSGGDDGDGDGDNNRKQTGRVGGCQGDDGCGKEDAKANEHQPKEQSPRDDDCDDDDDGDDNEEIRNLPKVTGSNQEGNEQTPSACGASGSSLSAAQDDGTASSCESTKKASRQGLKVDVTAAKMKAQAPVYESQEATCQPFPSLNQFGCHHLQAEETCHNAAAERLEKAFTCRRNLNSEREWQRCSEESCQEIQGFLNHSQNDCHMRVLGGCETCIQYKDLLLYHASKCHLPLGNCVVPKCDYIREYVKANRIPGNRNWKYEHDKLFFRSTPPSTPTNQENQAFKVDFEELLAQLEQAEAQQETAHGLGKDTVISDGSLTSYNEESLHVRDATGSWNHYHVDRPPEVQVTRGPTVQDHVQQECEDYALAAPLSAACMPVRDTCTSQTARSVVEEQGEVIWPLNKEKLSVGEDGTYIEGIHWQIIRFIGGGACGHCFLCLDVKKDSFIAIKKIPADKFEQNEIEIWGSLSGFHQNILELYGALKYRMNVIIFMEYMSGGSVKERAGQMNEMLAIHILGKVISAVDFMHSQGILHRDIKGANVLLDETGQHVKLADFGTSIRCDNFLQDNIPRGTEAFMAPEVCRSEHHSFSADIWSIMCLLHQMLAGSPPWMEYCHGSLIFKIGMASEPPQSPPCSPEVEDLFSQGFVLEPAARATARELLRHQVFMAAPDESDIVLPPWDDTEQYSDGAASSSSSYSSDATESVASETSADQLLSDGLTADLLGDNSFDDGNSSVGDDDDDHDDDDDDDDDFVCQMDTAIFTPQGPWQGEDLSAEQQLQSLQRDLFHSLPGEELERLVLSNVLMEGSDVSENDMNRLKDDNFDVNQFIDQMLSVDNQPMSNASPTSDWSYSITDLTKIHVKDSTGKLLFTIREKPTTVYGRLAEDLHGNIASLIHLDVFSLTQEDGAPLNVRAEIGSEEQAVRVVPAHDADNWQRYRWRVDDRGLVEEFFEF